MDEGFVESRRVQLELYLQELISVNSGARILSPEQMVIIQTLAQFVEFGSHLSATDTHEPTLKSSIEGKRGGFGGDTLVEASYDSPASPTRLTKSYHPTSTAATTDSIFLTKVDNDRYGAPETETADSNGGGATHIMGVDIARRPTAPPKPLGGATYVSLRVPDFDDEDGASNSSGSFTQTVTALSAALSGPVITPATVAVQDPFPARSKQHIPQQAFPIVRDRTIDYDGVTDD